MPTSEMTGSWDSRAGGVGTHPAERWLAAYTRARHEEKFGRYCESWGIEAFIPTHRSWRNWSDRRKQISLPLFPSYVFIHIDAAQQQRAVRAPGFLWFVRNEQGPVEVSAFELASIRHLLASGLEFDPLPGVVVGDEVEVVRGAMRGCRGRLLRKDSGSIALLVSAINGAIRVRIPEPDWLAPVRWRAVPMSVTQ